MDVMLDDNGDLDLSTGDFRINNNDLGHIESIILSQKGEWKQFPMIGVAMANYLNAPLSSEIRVAIEKEIKIQLESDSFTNIFVKVNVDGTVNVNASKNE